MLSAYILVVLLYLASGFLFYKSQRGLNPLLVLSAFFITCQAHAILLINSVGAGWNLSIFNVISMTSWAIASLSIFSLWRREMALAGVVISLLNALVVLLSAFFVSQKPLNFSGAMLFHIFTSLAAWTLLSLALMYSGLYLYFFQRLKSKKLKNLNMLSLANLERFSANYCLIGTVLLVISLISGLFFISEIVEKQLIHKTLLTLISTALYFWALKGFYLEGKKSNLFIYRESLAYGFLLMGYVISNIIIQFVIQ